VGTHRLKAVAALGWCAALGWVAFVRARSVPMLSLVDLGFHELGHLVTYPLPWDGVTAAMGTITQIAVPVGLAVYFLLRQRDRIGASVCLAWAATSAQNGAVYIADAPYERLPLIGGDHDWAFLLAPHLGWAAPIATAVRIGGVLALLGALALAASVLVDGRGQREAALGQPTFGMAHDVDDHPVPRVRPVGMVVEPFGFDGHRGHEGEGGREAAFGEHELPVQTSVDHGPVGMQAREARRHVVVWKDGHEPE
jgi:hypothetical protein